MKQNLQINCDIRKSLLRVFDALDPRCVFLVTGKGSYSRCGAKEVVEDAMNGIPNIQFSDFDTNPKLPDIRRGMEMITNKGCDVVVAVGGGSVIDTAKSVNALSCQDADPIDYVCGKRKDFAPGRPPWPETRIRRKRLERAG